MIKRLLFSCMVVLGGLFTACQDDNEIFLIDVIGEEDPEALHMRFRDQPYPKEGNTLYLNPPPLLVPEEVRADDGFLEFAVKTCPEEKKNRGEDDCLCSRDNHS